jgi:flagellar protein FliL
MATKAKPKAAEAPAEAAAAGEPKKKMMVIILAAVIASSAAAGGAVWFMSRSSKSSAPAKVVEVKASGPAIFVPLEPFTVNLQTESVDQFLQVTIHLQVNDLPTVDAFKANVAIVRNRILILLSSKKASEIASSEGKQKLADEVVEAMKQPFSKDGKPQDVSGALFTSFIVQ